MTNRRRHKRSAKVREAEAEARKALGQIVEKYGLTVGEEMSILGSYMQDSARYIIQDERTGEYDKEQGDTNDQQTE